MTRSFYYHLGAAAAGFTLLALLVRGVLRDRVPYLAALVYGTPPFVLAAGALAVAGLWALARRRRPALAALTAAFLLAGWQVGTSRFDHPQERGGLRLLLWNVQNGHAGWDRLAADVASFDADLIALVEADGGAPRAPVGWAWRWIDHGLGVGVRGSILSAEIVPLAEGSRAAVLELDVRGRRMTALLVDLVSNPLKTRGPAFRELDVLRRRVRPDLILGDFNTPRDTVHFDAWRGELTHAFEAAGSGWDLTWPARLPLLSIDHVWCGPRLKAVGARHERRSTSDHRAVVVELRE